MESIYLLSDKKNFSPSLKPYLEIIEKCHQLGEFLSYSTDQPWLTCYERDSQPHFSKIPLVVFKPHSIACISPFIKVCHAIALPVTIRCGGTGLAGSCVPKRGGIVLLTGHLNQIKEYDALNGKLRVEPGATLRQVNQHVSVDDWHFPLSMMSAGVAGLAGCLSSNARAYHRQQYEVLDRIEKILLVDGKGQTLELPAAMLCGSEGQFGVIIELSLKLKRKAMHSREFIFRGTWKEILNNLPSLQRIQSLHYLTWLNQDFYLGIEGELWRVLGSIDDLRQRLPGIEERIDPFEDVMKFFFPTHPQFIVISMVLSIDQLPLAIEWTRDLSQSLDLECCHQADVLGGSLHLLLQSKKEKESLYDRKEKIKHYLIQLCDFIKEHQGSLASCHGVGMQMSSYMHQFWTEESQKNVQNLRHVFDPKSLFN